METLLLRELLLKQMSKVCLYAEGKLTGLLLAEKIRLKVTLLWLQGTFLYICQILSISLGIKTNQRPLIHQNTTILQYYSLFAAEIRDHETGLVSGPFLWFQSRQIFRETHETEAKPFLPSLKSELIGIEKR